VRRKIFSTSAFFLIALLSVELTPASGRPAAVRLPENVPPVIMAWFLTAGDLAGDNYRTFLDMIAEHSAVNMLATSIRAPACEVTDEAVRHQVAAIARYARGLGIKIAMDLDVRLARRAFKASYPDELQEMLRVRDVALSDSGEVELRIKSSDLSDHYTAQTTHYIPLAGRLERVYLFSVGRDGILPESVRDVTCDPRLTVSCGPRQVVVRMRCSAETKGRRLCALAVFTHLTPAVFAPHLLQFQRIIIERYAETPISGACKDEWGFPPCYDGCPAKNDYWFSRWRAEEYRKRTGGRDLLRDCLLMTYGERGRERERQAAINHLLRMSTERNALIERDFYRTVKRVFGRSAFVGTHPTWYPYPGLREFKKNGLDWWQAPRDLAQTDEVTPFCVRTSLAKKWKSAFWWNMYYSSRRSDYDVEVWSSALAAGRIDYHPIYPRTGGLTFRNSYRLLLEGGLMRADCRIRMLNFICKSPLDCPVAVVFGHTCAMNWAGPAYNDVGIGLTDRLWRAGYPADLIPTTEITGKALYVDERGYIRYGPQSYRVVVLYHPQFEPPEVARFFARAARGKTILYRVGEWTRDFEARDFDGDGVLSGIMKAVPDAESAAAEVVETLKRLGVPPQFRATRTLRGFGRQSAAPPKRGCMRLTDGTVIFLSGEKNITGDPIRTTFQIRGHAVTVDAVGVAAVRMSEGGSVEALAAGGLKRFQGGGLSIELEDRLDLALWRNAEGVWQGVIQGHAEKIPRPLCEITGNWLRLALPKPLEASGADGGTGRSK